MALCVPEDKIEKVLILCMLKKQSPINIIDWEISHNGLTDMSDSSQVLGVDDIFTFWQAISGIISMEMLPV